MIIKPRLPAGNYVVSRRIPFGTHRDKLVERIILEHPDYICWFYDKKLDEQYPELHEYIVKCLHAFDAKPFVAVHCAGKIAGERCTKVVTRYSLTPTSCVPDFWCDDCHPPKSSTADSLEGKLYREGANHLWGHGYHRAAATQIFVCLLAKAKGLGEKPTDEEIIKFFHGPDARLLE